MLVVIERSANTPVIRDPDTEVLSAYLGTVIDNTLLRPRNHLHEGAAVVVLRKMRGFDVNTVKMSLFYNAYP